MTKIPPPGTRVRARLSGWYDTGQIGRGGEERRARWRATVTSRVVGWESPRVEGEGPWLDLAGYGRVPLAACRRARWWQR